ncbi:S53 family peptidase [Streptosporangium sandarakinum]
MRKTTPKALRRASLSMAAVAALALSALTATPATAQRAAPGKDEVQTARACATPKHAKQMACLALRVTGGKIPVKAIGPNTSLAAPSGYGPSQLQSAYNLPANGGAGTTVAITVAFDYPTAEQDLAVYRSQFGLPACTTANGCFKKVSQRGNTNDLPAPNEDWAMEAALDLDMVSAIAPNAHILLVEADSDYADDLGEAVNQAVKMGAKYVSNSWGGDEWEDAPTYDELYFNHPGVVLTFASGDSSYSDPWFGIPVLWPASSKYVTAVGGTSLKPDSSKPRGWFEGTWNGAGSGCSGYQTKPTWQTDTGCAKRTVADVSAVADPRTGVAVYYNGDGLGWGVFGGTSASAPIIAAVYANAGTPSPGSYPASYPYAHPSALNDITTGANGYCEPRYLCWARTGYDGPTGLGTPNGLTAFRG